MAISLPLNMSRDLYEAHIKHERFINTVRALTGRTEERAKLLHSRICKVAETSRYDSADSLMEEWRRRYIMGWRSPETRSHVKVKKAARSAFDTSNQGAR